MHYIFADSFFINLLILKFEINRIFIKKNDNFLKKNQMVLKENQMVIKENENVTKESQMVIESQMIIKKDYFCCFCAMGRKENLYSKELISYYMSIGVDKFVFMDNNLPNTEKISDVLQDYIKNGTVDIIEMFGSGTGQAELFGIMYNKYQNQCNWLTFF